MVVFRLKAVVEGQNVCARVNVVVFGQKLVVFGKRGCIRAKVVIFEEVCCIARIT